MRSVESYRLVSSVGVASVLTVMTTMGSALRRRHHRISRTSTVPSKWS